MPRLYITKWVLARGILVIDAKLEDAPTPRGYIPRAWVKLPGGRYGRPLLLGREVFLTLKEARADAKQRFATALKAAKAQVQYLTEAAKLLKKGELLVHKEGALVGRCHAFKEAGVHSTGSWIVDPVRLDREKSSGS